MMNGITLNYRGFKGAGSYNPETKIWYGPKHALPYDDTKSLGQVLLEKLLENPDALAQINCDDGGTLTNGQIADLALKTAWSFKKLNLPQGTVIGLSGGNTDFMTPLVIGALINGLILCCLDPKSSEEALQAIYSTTSPAMMFCDGALYDKVKSAFDGINLNIPIYTMNEHLPNVQQVTQWFEAPDKPEKFQFEPLEGGNLQTALIVVSSGTTGPQKAIRVTHATLLNFYAQEYFKASDRTLHFSSLFWVSGAFFFVGAILGGSTRLLTKNAFSTDNFLDIVQKYKPTTTMISPALLTMLAAAPRLKTADLSCLENVQTGGSPLMPASYLKINEYFKNEQLTIVYAMTEYPLGIISVGRPSADGSCGSLTANVELQIVNEQGVNCGPHEHGEIMVRTVLPFTGYYANEAATASALSNKDGWLATGDIGYMNEHMKLFIIDRKKDIIIYKNMHYYPGQIEDIVAQLPQIAEACVAGIASYKSEMFPAIILIVPKDNCSLSVHDIYAHLSSKMDMFAKIEGGIHFVRQIPKTATGKNLRRKLQNFLTPSNVINSSLQ